MKKKRSGSGRIEGATFVVQGRDALPFKRHLYLTNPPVFIPEMAGVNKQSKGN